MNPEESKPAKANAETVTEQKGWSKNGVTSWREKNLVIIGFTFGLLVLCLLCAIILTIVIIKLLPTEKGYCFTPHCVKKAGSILRAMNLTMNPCENFFNYVCGGWVEEYDVDEDSEIAILGKIQTKVYKKFDRIIENVKSSQDMTLNYTTSSREDVAYAGIKAIRTYDACNKLYDDYHPENIIPFMNAFGGWPMATKNWNDDGTSLEKRINAVLGDFGVASLFSISVVPDDDFPATNIIMMSVPQLPSFEVNALKVIANITKKASSLADSAIEDDLKEITKFGEEIANKTMDANGTEVITKVKDLQKFLTKNVNWEELFKLLLEGDTNVADAAKVPDVKVVLRNKEIIREIVNLANSLPKRTLNNYFAVHIILEHKLLIVKDVDPGANTRRSSPNTANVLTDMKETCLQTVAQMLNFAMDHVFVYRQTKSVDEASTLIDYIRRTFMHLIEGYPWLETSTREKLKKKLEFMNNYIDYPDWLMDKGKVDDYYRDYQYDDSSPVAAYVNMVKFGIRKMLATYKDINNRKEWPMLSMFSISTVNAFYIPQQNNFVLPRAILNPPIYDEKNPKYLTYGSIGAIIGHEITHGFDSEGRHYDEEGRMSKDIWTPVSTIEYDKLSQCFVKQYSKYLVDPAFNSSVNGEKTLGENIADNGGLRQAYMAYHLWLEEVGKGRKELSLPGLGEFSPDQMFFISYGQTWCISAGKKYLRNQVITDEHTPHRYRVIGTLSNMDEFARAFNCPEKSRMNPPNKCVLW